ncbi:MAG: ribosomal protein S18-alanine N-acetyltransferase [Gammaproteobacteria bacterium]
MSAILKQPAIDLRPMSESDIDAVMAIERRAYDFPWTEGIFRDCLRIGYCCLMCEENNSVAGYAVMSIGAGESHILNICIRPESRQRGLGRSLLTHMLNLAREQHAEITVLEVRPSNRAALELYQDMGFNEVGIRKSYYPAACGMEDAIILALSL